MKGTNESNCLETSRSPIAYVSSAPRCRRRIVVIFEVAALSVCAATRRHNHAKYSVAPVLAFRGEIAIDSHIFGECTSHQPVFASKRRSANDDDARCTN